MIESCIVSYNEINYLGKRLSKGNLERVVFDVDNKEKKYKINIENLDNLNKNFRVTQKEENYMINLIKKMEDYEEKVKQVKIFVLHINVGNFGYLNHFKDLKKFLNDIIKNEI